MDCCDRVCLALRRASRSMRCSDVAVAFGNGKLALSPDARCALRAEQDGICHMPGGSRHAHRMNSVGYWQLRFHLS